MKSKQIKWHSLFTRNGYPYFMLDLALSAYLYDMKKVVGWGYKDQLFISKNDLVTSYYSESDIESFLKFISNKKASFIKKTNKILENKILKAKHDFILIEKDILNSDNKKKLISVVQNFYSILRDAYGVYRFPSLVDLSGGDKIFKQEVLDDCAQTKYVWGEFSNYEITRLIKKIKRKLSLELAIPEGLILYMNCQEICDSLKKGDTIISVSDLKKRCQFNVLMSINGKVNFYIGKQAIEISNNLVNKNNEKEIILGRASFLGKVRGVVRIAYTVNDLKNLSKNTILVTPMTAVSFVSYLNNVIGIITDEGGLTCHASIISRELKIPCVVGTRIATKVLKNGDKIELDANNGKINFV
ncbi:MAG TPA: hypothetical protein DEB09_01010 [Candidatus Magasanikbacteria bacterium]|nr:hypothetical protein [Candidatus Magasanikbacteria bacterium]